jgi:hypothetical protein
MSCNSGRQGRVDRRTRVPGAQGLATFGFGGVPWRSLSARGSQNKISHADAVAGSNRQRGNRFSPALPRAPTTSCIASDSRKLAFVMACAVIQRI